MPNNDLILSQLADALAEIQERDRRFAERAGNVVTTAGAILPENSQDEFRLFVLSRAFECSADDMLRGRGHAAFTLSGHRWANGEWHDYSGDATGVWVRDEEGLLAEKRVEATVELMEQGLVLGIADLRAECDTLEERHEAERDPHEAEKLERRLEAMKAKLANLARARAALRSRTTRDTMLRDARKHLDAPAFDAHDTHVNTPAGLLDLDTLELRAGHLPGDFAARVTSVDYDPNAEDPRWTELVDGLTRGPDGKPDPELRRYLQTLLGSMVLGLTNLRLSVLLTGPPRSMKTTFLTILCESAGDYLGIMSAEGLARGDSSKQGANTLTPELELLVGRRGVVVDELEDDFVPNVALFKRLTGSSSITINPKGRKPYKARTTATVVMASNGSWKMPPGESAGWARLYVVNLEHARQFAEEDADKRVTAELASDPAMRRCALRFLVEGAQMLLHARGAVTPPKCAEDARERMRRESNSLHDAIELEVLRLDPEAATPTGELLRALHEYARDTGRGQGWVPSAKQLGRDLKALGCSPAVVGPRRLRGWRGIGLGPESPRGLAAEAADARPAL